MALRRLLPCIVASVLSIREILIPFTLFDLKSCYYKIYSNTLRLKQNVKTVCFNYSILHKIESQFSCFDHAKSSLLLRKRATINFTTLRSTHLKILEIAGTSGLEDVQERHRGFEIEQDSAHTLAI